MLSLTLALVLSASHPSAAEAWAKKACPLPKKEADSNAEFKAQQSARVECLKKAMNKALDKVIVPLKKKDPPAFKEWMALQADYNRWMADTCAAVEEAMWVDTSTGERSMGTGYGTTEMACLQGQYTWRGYFADAWSRNDWKNLFAALDVYAQSLPLRREELKTYMQRAQAAAQRAPAKAEQSDTPSQKLTKDDWAQYNARLERAATAPQKLVERQCTLLPKAGPTCAELFLPGLMAHLDFHEVLSTPPQTP